MGARQNMLPKNDKQDREKNMKSKATILIACIAFVILFCCACDDRPRSPAVEAIPVEVENPFLELLRDDWKIVSFCYEGFADTEFEMEVYYPDTYEFVDCAVRMDGEERDCITQPERFKCLCQGIQDSATNVSVLLKRGETTVAQLDMLVADVHPDNCMWAPDNWTVTVTCFGGGADPVNLFYTLPEGLHAVGCDAVDQDGVSYACNLITRSGTTQESCDCPGMPSTTTDAALLLSFSDGTSTEVELPVMDLRIRYACTGTVPTATPETVQGGVVQPGSGGQQGGAQPATGCAAVSTYDDCKMANCSWWSDGTCHDSPEPVCVYGDQKSCEAGSCYWWQDACHIDPFSCNASYGTDKDGCLADPLCDWDGAQCNNK